MAPCATRQILSRYRDALGIRSFTAVKVAMPHYEIGSYSVFISQF